MSNIEVIDGKYHLTFGGKEFALSPLEVATLVARKKPWEEAAITLNKLASQPIGDDFEELGIDPFTIEPETIYAKDNKLMYRFKGESEEWSIPLDKFSDFSVAWLEALGVAEQ